MGPPYVIGVWAMWNEQLSGVPIPGCKNWLLLYGMPPLWLDIVWLTSTHGLCSGTSLLERGWTLLQSGIAPSSVSVCWGFPWTIRVLIFFSMCLWIWELVLYVVWVYATKWAPHSHTFLPLSCQGTSICTWTITVKPEGCGTLDQFFIISRIFEGVWEFAQVHVQG